MTKKIGLILTMSTKQASPKYIEESQTYGTQQKQGL